MTLLLMMMVMQCLISDFGNDRISESNQSSGYAGVGRLIAFITEHCHRDSKQYPSRDALEYWQGEFLLKANSALGSGVSDGELLLNAAPQELDLPGTNEGSGPAVILEQVPTPQPTSTPSSQGPGSPSSPDSLGNALPASSDLPQKEKKKKKKSSKIDLFA